MHYTFKASCISSYSLIISLYIYKLLRYGLLSTSVYHYYGKLLISISLCHNLACIIVGLCTVPSSIYHLPHFIYIYIYKFYLVLSQELIESKIPCYCTVACKIPCHCTVACGY